MINIDDKTRRLSQATIVVGYKQENKAESIEFEIPEYLKEYGKKICFKTKDGKVFSKLFDNTTSNIFTFTRTETQYGELDATIQFFKAEDEDIIVYKTSMLHIIFKDAVICEDEIQPDDPKYPIIEDLIIKVSNITKDITTINKNIEDIDKKNNEQDTKIKTNETDIADIKKVNIKQDNNIKELQTENEQLKNQIPNGTASGNSIHIEDSSDLEFKWGLNGGHKQEIGENSPSLDYPSEIETVGSNINLFDKDNVNKINAYFDSTIHSNSANRVFWLKIDKNQDYTISKVKGKVFAIAFTDQLPKAGVSIYGTKYNNTGEVITTNSGSYDYLVCYYWTTSDVLTEQQIIDSIKIEKGTVATPYSPYGQGSVKIDVVNNNLSDFNVTQNGKVKVNEDGTITINGNGGFSLSFRKFIVKANTKYYSRWELISGTVSGVNIFMNPILKKGWINKDTFVESSVTEDSEISDIWINGSAVFSNAKIKIWISKSQNDFTKHQSQSVTMPIQQEMLTGDYISSVEHHEWGKIESYNGETITTDYISTTGELTTGATVYYKLATPLDLELTTEQKVIREQKLHTYKNVTNISLSNDLSNVDVSYKKDIETMFNNLQSKLIANIEKPK